MSATDLVVRDGADLTPRIVVPLSVLKDQLDELQRFKLSIMVENEDYGVIPGTPKPTLLKPGAEKLALAFGLTPIFTVSNKIEDWNGGLFFYEVTCDLYSRRTGERVANGIGSANSREPRYRWRRAERQCPNCGAAAIIKGKAEFGGGWVCFDKKGGCRSKFSDNDQRIVGQVTGNVENPEPFELVNTLVKMGQKRALVAAVLVATGGSGIWTQDVEDMPSVSGEAPQPPAASEPARATPSSAEPKMVTSARSSVMQRYASLLEDLVREGGNADPWRVELPVLEADLTKVGRDLVAEINRLRDAKAAAAGDLEPAL